VLIGIPQLLRFQLRRTYTHCPINIAAIRKSELPAPPPTFEVCPFTCDARYFYWAEQQWNLVGQAPRVPLDPVADEVDAKFRDLY
jgi:hypothetical protein